MTLSELINRLEEIESKYGDLEVLASKDEEGNGFGDVWQVTVNLSRSYDYEVDLIHSTDWEERLENTMLDEGIDREAAIALLRKDGIQERVVIWP